MKEILRYGFILGIICLASSGILTVVNALTEPQIKIQKQKEETAALQTIFPEGAEFIPKPDRETAVYYLVFDTGHLLKGFILKAQQKGYSSTIEILTAVNTQLKIRDIKILYQNETPGLGTKITESNFTRQFKDKGIDTLDTVQAISGATISSSAVIKAVRSRLTELNDELLSQIRTSQ